MAVYQAAKRTLSIKNKLIIVGILFVTNVLALESISSYSDRQVDKAATFASIRQEQIGLLTAMEISLTKMVLAAMDAIVDRESGKIAEDLKEQVSKTSAFWREQLPMLGKLADTENERRLANEIVEGYPRLEKMITADLTQLVVRKATKDEFDKIDDDIDGLGEKIDITLMAVIESVKEENREAAEEFQRQLKGASTTRRAVTGLMLGLIGCALFIIARSILRPILAVSVLVQDVAQGEGDLTKRLISGNDEVGILSTHFNSFMTKLHGIITQVQANISILNSSAGSLSQLSRTLATGSAEATGRANTVATAAEEMAANINVVAAASEQAAVNINMVASAAEQMSATVSQIAGSTDAARKIAEEAVMKTEKAAERVDMLGSAANDISKVTEVITEISEQTNLLALNATIEAARAGEAGKGFAVVADEIKELAKQTAQATQEIRKKIEAIQSSTDLTITEITGISTIINKVNDIVGNIATAVSEQTASTNEIAGNVSQAAQGINEVNENVSQVSGVSGEISKEITGVSQVAEQLRESSTAVNSQSDNLAVLAGQLAQIVNQFKL